MALLTETPRQPATQWLVKTLYVTTLEELKQVIDSLELMQCGYRIEPHRNADAPDFDTLARRGGSHYSSWWSVQVFRDRTVEPWPLSNDASY